MFTLTKKKTAALGTTIVALLVASIAFAAWTSTGEGTGEATATTALNSVISPEDSGDALYPGGDTTIEVKITNPNSYPVVVTWISAGNSDAIDDCVPGSVSTAEEGVENGFDAAVPQKGGGTQIAENSEAIYELSASMDGGAHDDCQGATFNIDLNAQLRSDAS